MQPATHKPQVRDVDQVVQSNREAFARAGVFVVCIIGSPGCGKTRLIDATIDRLPPSVRVGIIACERCSRCDADRIARHTDKVVQVLVGEESQLRADHVAQAIQQLKLDGLDLLLIECSGTLSLRAPPQVGQDVTVTIFSIAGGDDKAEKHPELVRAANLILLNKSDLMRHIPFNLHRFRDDVRKINPSVHVIEVSGLHGTGIDNWIRWLRPTGQPGNANVSHWFG